jgi:hypothetical protein
MKTIALSLLVLLAGLSPFRTLANSHPQKLERIELLKIGSELYPDQTYSLGIEVDSLSRAMQAIYFRDPYPDAQTPYQRFPITTLSRPQVMIRVKNEYDLVKIAMTGKSLTVYFRRDVRENKWTARGFELDCNSNFSSCGVMDPQSHRYVTKAFITTHRAMILGVFEKAVGIEAILTQ